MHKCKNAPTDGPHFCIRALLGSCISSVIRRSHRRLDAAAGGEVADDGEAARLKGRDQVVEDLVRDVLVEDASVPEGDHVVLERLELDTPRVGYVRDADLSEIGQPGFRTDRGELRTADGDLVVALGPRVGERLE